MGPYSIDVAAADRAAGELSEAISAAANEVDLKRARDVRAETVALLAAAGLGVDPPDAPVIVSPGDDGRVWLSLTRPPVAGDAEQAALAEHVVKVVRSGGLALTCPTEPHSHDVAARLARGEALWVERVELPDPRSPRNRRGASAAT
jgi:hypothetical protein